MATHNSLEHFHNAFIYLSQIGYDDVSTNYHPIYCLRDMHVIHYVKSGRGYLKIFGQTINVEQGSAFYIPPNCVATYGTYEGEGWEIYYFAFNGCYADELINSTMFKNKQFVGKVERGEELSEIIKMASAEIKEHSFPQFYGLEQLFRLLPLIMQESKVVFQTAKEKYLALCKDYIDGHYSENLQISDVAKAVNLSMNYIYRIFKETLNISPHDYLTSVRMQYAKKYLIETDISTHEIASRLGYANYTTFYSIFNKKMHMSPHEYRLLQVSKQSRVEENSATTIRIFRKIEDCRFLEYMATKTLLLEEDEHYNSKPLQESYLRRLKYKKREYDLFAYVFENIADACEYFENVTEVKVHDEQFEFKMKCTNDSVLLVVMNGCSLYKLSGEDLNDFNEFRHALNHIFQKILLN